MTIDYSKIQGDLDIMEKDLREHLFTAVNSLVDKTISGDIRIPIGEYVFVVHKCTIAENPTMIALITVIGQNNAVLRVYEFHMRSTAD